MSDIITEIKNSDRGSFFFDIEEDEEEMEKPSKIKNTRGKVGEKKKEDEKESVVDRLFKNKPTKKPYYFKN